ncbi:hypothetical protein ACVXHA_12780 [Escherichia coli]
MILRKIHFIVDRKSIAVYAEKGLKISVESKGAEIIVECTGFYTSAKSQAHLDAGAKKVLISAPAGRNENLYRL